MSIIIAISPDDFAECPECCRRLEPTFEGSSLLVIGQDVDGPIHQGTCQVHGTFDFQVIFEAEDDR